MQSSDDSHEGMNIMQKYTLIGHPLGHSMSPFIHSELFKLNKIDAEYDCTDICPEDLSQKAVMLRNLNGYNITIPYKREIIQYTDILDESAKRYGAVNCIHNLNGRSVGYNTDCTGFLMSVKSLGLTGKVLLIGCGGVGRMIAIETALHGADLTIGIIPEAAKSAADLCNEIDNLSSGKKVHVRNIESVSGKYDLIINASPVGMYPKSDACPIYEELISECGGVFDAIYNPVKTKLIRTAQSFGKPTVNGTAMLVYQAVKAHEIWNGEFYTDDQIQKIINATNKIIEGDFK